MSETAEISVEFRQRLIAAARRAQQWRLDRIMAARVTWVFCRRVLGLDTDWHSLFECDGRHHHHHPLSGDAAKWVGPYSFEDSVSAYREVVR